MPNAHHLESLLARWETALEADQPVSPETLCIDWPEGLPELRRQIELLQKLAPALAIEEGDHGVDTAPTVALPGRIEWPTVAGYEVLGELGRGGMGVVYKARQQALDRLVALKVPYLTSPSSAELRQRFTQEARAAAGLEHPNIVPVYEAGVAGSVYYIASAYVAGPTLAAWLKTRSKPVSPRQAALLTAALAEAVACVHARGILHRDVKPGNVLLAPRRPGSTTVVLEEELEFTPQLTDFGLAKFLDADQQLTDTGRVLGTPAYLSPEQAAGESNKVTAATDVWGLGVLLYELLTGRQPFGSAAQHELLRQIQRDDPTPPSAERGGISPDLEAICLRCLEKKPERRYTTAAALAEDLRRWLRGEATRVRPWSWSIRVWRTARRKARRNAGTLLGALALVAAVVLLIALDTNRAIRDEETRLASGNPVTLVAERGKPRWARWQAGEAAAQVSEAPDGAHTVHSWTLGLEELVRDPHSSHYRLSAEVRHERADVNGRVGLYFGYRQYPTGGKPIHQFGYAIFNDMVDIQAVYADHFRDAEHPPPPPKGNQVRLGVRFHTDDDMPARDFYIRDVSPELFHPLAPRGQTWRRLTVEVTPELVRAWFNEQLVGELSFAELRKLAEVVLEEVRQSGSLDLPLGEVNESLDPRGALGLFVQEGSVSFRNVVLEPLK